MKLLSLFACVQIVIFSTAYSAIKTASSQSVNFIAEYNKAKNEALPMSQRWEALQKASVIASGDEFSKVSEFGDSKDWFMRNASLVALDKSGNDSVYDQATKLIKDKALVVRSASAEILSRLDNNNVRRIFSEELEKKYNFNGKSSLWVRNQMMKYLSQHPKKSEKDFFIRYLYDIDTDIAFLSSQALEKITDIRFTGKNSADVVKQWQGAVKSQRW